MEQRNEEDDDHEEQVVALRALATFIPEYASGRRPPAGPSPKA
jgi:hypothetical protein